MTSYLPLLQCLTGLSGLQYGDLNSPYWIFFSLINPIVLLSFQFRVLGRAVFPRRSLPRTRSPLFTKRYTKGSDVDVAERFRFQRLECLSFHRRHTDRRYFWVAEKVPPYKQHTDSGYFGVAESVPFPQVGLQFLRQHCDCRRSQGCEWDISE